MYERFTDRARKVMQLANQEAQRFHHEYVGTEHILLGLVKEGSGVGANVLKNMDVNLAKIRSEVEKLVQAGPDMVTMGKLPQTPRAKKVIEYSIEEARNLNHNYVGSEHLLMGLLREEEGIAAQVLMNLGLKLNDVREEVLNILGHGTAQAAEKKKSKTPALDSFCRDLTELALQGKLEPVIAREKEIQRVIQVLLRRTRNNPVLVGRAGVGKTAIVEGLAHLIAFNTCPVQLRDHRVLMLDLPMMVAGTKYRGQFEERLKACMNEIRRNENVILAIDDVHTLVGAGSMNGSMDAAFILKPAFARGEIRCIGTSTLDEYHSQIEKDATLNRHFQQVRVEQPTRDETIAILFALRERYESYHHVEFADAAIKTAVEMSELFLPQEFLPGKAINLIDEAGAQLRLTVSPQPPDLQSLDEQIEKLHLSKEKAVADQDFAAGARFRDQAEALISERENLLREWDEQPADRNAVVGETEVIEVLSQLTGIDAEIIRNRDTSELPERPLELATVHPTFEKLQCESILQGQEVNITPGLGFVLIPHDEEFRGIYEAAIRPAMAENGIEAKIAGDIYEPGSILNQVWSYIRTAEVIVADVSDQNPNVVYELGLCFGLRRLPIILVRDAKALPFNLRALRYLQYEDNAMGSTKLRKDLSAAIREFLAATRSANTSA